ncbi:MAG: Hsp20/alpha crystallin family protein [Planctomycetaceae bacterium]|nr:Hsp20/alpha crystallin family protein [Planctomycetaceae bacterium]
MAIFRFPGAFDPFNSFRYMQRELDRLFGKGMALAQQIGGGVYPPVNVYNGRDDMIVECEMSGVKREDIDISITGETLVIKGVKKAPTEDEVAYQRCERGSGDFSRTIVLPDRVDADKVDASLVNGLLTVRLPKSEAARPKQISVK